MTNHKNILTVADLASMGGKARWKGTTKEQRKKALKAAHDARRKKGA